MTNTFFQLVSIYIYKYIYKFVVLAEHVIKFIKYFLLRIKFNSIYKIFLYHDILILLFLDPGYSPEMFLAVQHAVSQEIIKAKGGDVIPFILRFDLQR